MNRNGEKEKNMKELGDTLAKGFNTFFKGVDKTINNRFIWTLLLIFGGGWALVRGLAHGLARTVRLFIIFVIFGGVQNLLRRPKKNES